MADFGPRLRGGGASRPPPGMGRLWRRPIGGQAAPRLRRGAEGWPDPGARSAGLVTARVNGVQGRMPRPREARMPRRRRHWRSTGAAPGRHAGGEKNGPGGPKTGLLSAYPAGQKMGPTSGQILGPAKVAKNRPNRGAQKMAPSGRMRRKSRFAKKGGSLSLSFCWGTGALVPKMHILPRDPRMRRP